MPYFSRTVLLHYLRFQYLRYYHKIYLLQIRRVACTVKHRYYSIAFITMYWLYQIKGYVWVLNEYFCS
jgi:hypothetical protein